jgi:hypothetical protein
MKALCIAKMSVSRYKTVRCQKSNPQSPPNLVLWRLHYQHLFLGTWNYDQINAQFYLFNNNITAWSSTCFEHRCAHLQEDNCIFAVSGIVTLISVCCHTVHRSRADCSPLLIGALHRECDDTRYCKYTIVLLKMSTAMLETCWGSWCNIIIE